MIADRAALIAELKWATSRKDVCGLQPIDGDDADVDISPAAFLAATRAIERQRLQEYASVRPGQACDLFQNPQTRPISTRRGHLMTITANIGMLWSRPHGRWFATPELLCAMGFPCTVELVAACAGTQCCFSPGVDPPPSRSIKSLRRQVGNSMHVNMIGAFQSVLLFALPMLGDRKCDRCSGSTVQPLQPSGFDSSAFQAGVEAARLAFKKARHD
jgi:hypothetical protein